MFTTLYLLGHFGFAPVANAQGEQVLQGCEGPGSGAVALYTPSAEDGLSILEYQLGRAINSYRLENGLSEIAFSSSLTLVAGRHVLDTVRNQRQFGSGEPGENKPHSWSDASYDGRNSETYKNMWLAPQRLGTTYPSSGFEISTGFVSGPANRLESSNFMQNGPVFKNAAAILDSWKNSAPHNDVILSRGIWAQERLHWKALGVGVCRGVAHVWFGVSIDPAGQPIFPSQ
jgi:hypothetical protein